MSRAFAGPGKYIQRAGEISRLADHLRPLGARAFVLVDPFLVESLGPRIRTTLGDAGMSVRLDVFAGECTLDEIARVSALAREFGSEMVVAVGGGKTADTVKIAAHEVGARTIIVPTIAATDAACSAVAVRYTHDGVYEGSARLPQNPDLVIVDTDIVVAAPVRFLIAGIGDALSTWFEARSNLESQSPNYVAGGFPPTETGVAIARACHDVLRRDARKAKVAVEAGLRTLAVENVIEANMLLSSIGFENLGCSAAHSIHDGLTALPETHKMLHGEKVAFGTVCLLMLENRPVEEIDETIEFCRDLGLPITLGELGITGDLRSKAERIAEVALAPGESTYATPVEVTLQSVTDAILATDRYARAFLSSPRR